MLLFAAVCMMAGCANLRLDDGRDGFVSLADAVPDAILEIRCDGKSLAVRYRGWVCSYATDSAIVDTGRTCCNRNGRYRVFEARGKKSLTVKAFISKTQRQQGEK